MAENHEDKREYRRIPITTKLRFRKMDLPGETERVIEKAVTNVSGGGIFVPGSETYEKGALIQMEFRIPSRRDKVLVMGRVVWTGPQGMGVEFLKIDPRVKAEIIRNAKRGAWVESSPELPPVKVTPAPAPPSPAGEAALPERPTEGAGGFAAPPPAPTEEPSPPGEDPFKF